MTDQEIMSFAFEGEHLFRAIPGIDGDQFYAVDIGRILKIKNIAQMVESLAPDERSTICSAYGGPDRILVSEGGMWTIVLRNRDAMKPGTLSYRLRRFITGEVMPALRKRGTYHLPGVEMAKEGEIIAPDDMSSLPVGTKLELVSGARLSWGAAASQEVWALVKLPITPSMEFALRQRAFDMGGVTPSREVAIFRPRDGSTGGAA